MIAERIIRLFFDDISPVLLEDHLRKTGSKLAKQVKERGVEEILEDMQLLVGPPELRYIQKCGNYDVL